MTQQENVPTPKNVEDLWTPKQLAAHHGIPSQTVRKAAQRGNIPGCFKILGQYYFDPSMALRWVPAAVRQAAEGRDLQGACSGKKGGFGKGNTLGVRGRSGRPKRKVEQKYLKALSNAVGPEEWQQIIEKAVAQAILGEWRARKWISDYLMGTPVKRILKEVDLKTTHTFELGERAAAVQALLGAARQKHENTDAITGTARHIDSD